MIYLNRFTLASERQEHDISFACRNIHTTYYPLHLFADRGLSEITFEPVTVFCGANGCGKTTLLNIIADRTRAVRRNTDDRGELFRMYMDVCRAEMNASASVIKYISSDDVFDWLLDTRAISTNVSRRKEELYREYMDAKYGEHEPYTLQEYDELKKTVDSRRMTVSAYTRSRLTRNTPVQQSNGETALQFWQNEISDGSLCIIDEPENSLSAENQIRLKQYIEESARFYGCQFIISSHSPFLLAIDHVKIYDLDQMPVTVRKWEEIESVKTYQEFFKEREDLFGRKS